MSNTSTTTSQHIIQEQSSQHIIQEQSIQQLIPNQGSRTRVPTPPVAPYIDATRYYNRIRTRTRNYSPNRNFFY